jgi:hypothetical protein
MGLGDGRDLGGPEALVEAKSHDSQDGLTARLAVLREMKLEIP